MDARPKPGQQYHYLQWPGKVTIIGPAPDGPGGPWFYATDHKGREAQVDLAGLRPVREED